MSEIPPFLIFILGYARNRGLLKGYLPHVHCQLLVSVNSWVPWIDRYAKGYSRLPVVSF